MMPKYAATRIHDGSSSTSTFHHLHPFTFTSTSSDLYDVSADSHQNSCQRDRAGEVVSKRLNPSRPNQRGLSAKREVMLSGSYHCAQLGPLIFDRIPVVEQHLLSDFQRLRPIRYAFYGLSNVPPSSFMAASLSTDYATRLDCTRRTTRSLQDLRLDKLSWIHTGWLVHGQSMLAARPRQPREWKGPLPKPGPT